MLLRRSTQHLLAAAFAASALLLTACGDEPAAERSAASDPTGTPEPSDVPPRGPTVVPDDFPLTSGWPESDGSSEYRLSGPSRDTQGMVAAGDLTACDVSVEAGDAADRLTTRLSWGSAAYTREIQLFADPAAADGFAASARAVYTACPTNDQDGTPPTFTTEVGRGSLGDQSLVITRSSDGVGRVVIHVVRIGNAVVVDLASDEGTGSTVMDLATETRENLADVTGATNELQS